MVEGLMALPVLERPSAVLAMFGKQSLLLEKFCVIATRSHRCLNYISRPRCGTK